MWNNQQWICKEQAKKKINKYISCKRKTKEKAGPLPNREKSY